MLIELFDNPSSYNLLENNTEKILRDKNIVLYGAGEFGIHFLNKVVYKYNFNIVAILDKKFKKGDTYEGISCYFPSEYKLEDNEKNFIVIIAISNKDYYDDIFNCLKNIGFKNIKIISDFYECQLPIMPERLKLLGFDYYIENKDNIIKAKNLFKDNLSIEIYNKFLKIHMQRKSIKIPRSIIEEQYFPSDIKLNYNRFINCGAYTGDTVQQLNLLKGKIKSLICFEPDLQNYKILIDYLHSKDNIADEIISFPCGVFDIEKIFNFSSGCRTASTLSDAGNDYIQCVSLDNTLINFDVTFINMDIEGAELKALQGAEKILKKYKPDLAICVYHKPEDIWKIPLYINSLNLGYKFYLRNYTGFVYETVLYASLG